MPTRFALAAVVVSLAALVAMRSERSLGAQDAEFPAGPFVIEAHLTLAYFYDDLFKTIRLEETDRRVGYKYDCYKPYLSNRPLAEQRLAAQQSGVKFYSRLVELLPQNEGMKGQLTALIKGTTNSWFYCAD